MLHARIRWLYTLATVSISHCRFSIADLSRQETTQALGIRRHWSLDLKVNSSLSKHMVRLVLIILVIGPCVVSRSKVVDELIARVQTYHIIRVRGTPASGKTTLMKLMVNKLLASDPETPVYIISGWDRKSVCEEGGWGAYLAKRTGIHGHQWLGHRGYLFLDEAQESYWDGELWASFFKTIDRTYNPYIVIFTSYGSPTEGSTGFESHLYIKTPMVFGDGQQISLRPIQSINTGLQPVGLLLDEGEANEVVEKLAPNVVANGWAALTEDLKKGLFLSSNGHVGLLTSLINILRDVPVSPSLDMCRQTY